MSSLKAIKTGQQKLQSEVNYYQSLYNMKFSPDRRTDYNNAIGALNRFNTIHKVTLATIARHPFLAK